MFLAICRVVKGCLIAKTWNMPRLRGPPLPMNGSTAEPLHSSHAKVTLPPQTLEEINKATQLAYHINSGFLAALTPRKMFRGSEMPWTKFNL
jgi:hypothetical protein